MFDNKRNNYFGDQQFLDVLYDDPLWYVLKTWKLGLLYVHVNSSRNFVVVLCSWRELRDNEMDKPREQEDKK